MAGACWCASMGAGVVVCWLGKPSINMCDGLMGCWFRRSSFVRLSINVCDRFMIGMFWLILWSIIVCGGFMGAEFVCEGTDLDDSSGRY